MKAAFTPEEMLYNHATTNLEGQGYTLRTGTIDEFKSELLDILKFGITN